MSSEGAGGEPIVIVNAPAEFVNQDTKRDGAVDTTPRDDYIGACVERRRDGKRAEIRIRAGKLLRQRLAGEHLRDVFLAKLGLARQEVVSLDGTDF